MPPRPITRVRKLCLAFPEAHEVEAWGEPTFRVRNKLFAMFASAENHHGAGRPGVWIKAASENQAAMINGDPDRYFKPPYVGPSGWIGMWLDHSPDWDLLRDLLADGYRRAAPKKLAMLVPPA